LIMPIGGSSLPIKTQEDCLILARKDQQNGNMVVNEPKQGGNDTVKRSYDKKISDYIEDHQQELIELLQECVRIPSITGMRRRFRRGWKDGFRKWNLDTVCFEADYDIVSKHPAFIDSGIPFKGRPNVIGIWKGNKSAPFFDHNGHCDVVSPERCRRGKKIHGELRSRMAGSMGEALLRYEGRIHCMVYLR